VAAAAAGRARRRRCRLCTHRGPIRGSPAPERRGWSCTGNRSSGTRHETSLGLPIFRFTPASPDEAGKILSDILKARRVALAGKFTVVERDRIRQRSLSGKKDRRGPGGGTSGPGGASGPAGPGGRHPSPSRSFSSARLRSVWSIMTVRKYCCPWLSMMSPEKRPSRTAPSLHLIRSSRLLMRP